MRPSSSPKRTANRAIEAFTPKALILNHELRQCFIIGDIGIGKAGLIQPFENPVKLLGGWVCERLHYGQTERCWVLVKIYHCQFQIPHSSPASFSLFSHRRVCLSWSRA